MARRSFHAVLTLVAVSALVGCSHKVPGAGYVPDGGEESVDDMAGLVDGGAMGDPDLAAPAPDLAPGMTGCSSGSPMAECQTNADCDDKDPSTTDTCQLDVGGEFPSGVCLHAGCDGGVSCAMQAVDTTCGTDAGVAYPPYVPLIPPDVPQACASGFELGDAASRSNVVFVYDTKTAAGSRAIMADLDFATYTAPDGLQITGVDGSCKKYILFDSCRLKTADLAETFYTNGKSRPSDPAIRQYHLAIRQGTSQLTFDFSRVNSPMYVRVLGLCDFNVTQPPAGSAKWFRVIP